MRGGSVVAGLLIGLVSSSASWIDAQYDCRGISETSNSTLLAYRIVTGVSQPVFVSGAPGDTTRLFIVERAGRIKIHRRGTDTTTLLTFLNITSKVNSSSQEMGLLGLAFDPDYQATGYFWVNYTEVVDGQIFTVIARYRSSRGSPDIAEPTSEMRILRFAQPESNHNGGMLIFGSDGFLYVFTGDGGGSGDQHGLCGNGQSRSVLLGKILRLDVRSVDPESTPPDCGLVGANYGVPKSNPFRDGPGVGFCDEVWAYGLRNPWRASFDALIGDLYIADVGQAVWEEVDWAPATSTGGENYGWRQMEGPDCFSLGGVCGDSPLCNDSSLTLPVLSYRHGSPCSIIGGYVYRGCRMPNFRGTYFYADLCAGWVRTFRVVGGVVTDPQDITNQLRSGGATFISPTSFGVDGLGELYLMEFGGRVWKIGPPFQELEVSAPDAADSLRLAKAADWTWEDLFFATDIPIASYRVYRGSPGGAYSCIFNTTSPKWPAGGDPVAPVSGQLFSYVVTAVAVVDFVAVETKPGTVGTFNPATCP